MTFTFRASFLVVVVFLVLLLFYLSRNILTPFILAAIFAYISNPAVNYLERNKVPRGLSTALIFVLLISIFGYLGTTVVSRVISEWEELSTASVLIFHNAQAQISLLPPFLQGIILEPIKTIQLAVTKPQNIWPFFSGAFSGVLNTLVFIFAGFYFLKEGEKLILGIVGSPIVPKKNKQEVKILLDQINNSIGKYLRGLSVLVILMMVISFIALSILGVKSSLLLAILIGLAEVVPVFGPIIIGTIATLFAVFDGASRFGFTPVTEGLIVAGGYFVLNQIENYLIVPHLMSKVTNLHPLVVLFSVIAGGQIFGILGVVLAVPIVTSLRIVLTYILSKLEK